MKVARSVAQARAERADLRAPVGFVPTMGALHAGHTSLVERARAECESVVVSLYVNPLQFAPGEDFSRYPRTFERDAALLEAAGADLLFAPSDEELVGANAPTAVEVGAIAAHLEGERRPGHFRGVATIVHKLFDVIRPQRAYFGQKDAQQLAVVRRMTAEMDLPVEIVQCPIVRDSDGLALSSRNAYLSDEERREAVRLSRVLRTIADGLRDGRRDIAALIRESLPDLAPLRNDYVAVVDSGAFEPLEFAPAGAELLVVGAAYCGATRLIDNMEVRTP
ncbi:MAG TPA: pantoate--beta-alanine ligase [Candidatus Eremiobacteraceae bacterium]|nr:pantoate--beta-alanine ligase [Candidatus Eremiobacteraceae bacterium]